jgi:hypothetical protein
MAPPFFISEVDGGDWSGLWLLSLHPMGKFPWYLLDRTLESAKGRFVSVEARTIYVCKI